MNYKSFLNKDYKNMQRRQMSRVPSRIKRHHVLISIAVCAVCALIFTLVSLEASANKQIENARLNPENKIILPIEIPTLPQASSDELLLETMQSEPGNRWIDAKVKKGDSLAVIFRRHNLPSSDLHQIMQHKEASKRLRYVKPGQNFRIQIDQDNDIQSLEYQITPLEALVIERNGDEFNARQQHKDVEVRTHHASAVIKSSLFEAGRDAGLSNSLTMEAANIFGWDIDFALDIRQGDRFTIIYEEHFLDGKKINDGPILAAEFVNQGKTYQAIRYTDANNRSDYYSPDGMSMRKAFLRTPVDFSRISSRFGKRKHPVLNSIRMHTGVDYAAQTGTPIRASGDGKIVVKGTKGGYGRTIIIQHGGSYSTLYAHMSAYKSGMHVGKRVKQGQVIGYVGSSGRATGPHLHYEFRVNGAHRNPLTIRLPNAQPINKNHRQAFKAYAATMLNKIEMFKETHVAFNSN